MKQMKRVLAILLAVIMLIGTVPVVSMAAPQYTRLGNSSIGYYLDEEGTLTLQGRGSTPDYDSGDSPFDFRYENDLNIKRVVIKEGITRLGNMLFIGCPMESISLPDSLNSIGNYALYSCDNLSELELPSNLTDYGLQPFGGCDYLEQITFHSSTVTCRFLYFYQAQMSHGLFNGLRDTIIRIPLPFTIHETENNKTTVIRSNLQAEEVLLVDEEDNNTVQCLNDCSLVTWKNFDGSTLSLTSAPVGETPVFDGETPQRATDENHYTFAGWSDGETTYSSDSLPKTVKNQDVVYTAVYSTRPHAYGEPVWTWSEDKLCATAQFVCTDGDCAYQVTKDAVITREVRENKLVSTASVTFNGNTYTNEYEQDFTGGYLLNFAQSEHGTAESDKYYAESGEKVTITFRPDEGYTLEEYSYEYFSTDGTSQGGKVTSITKYYDKTEYELPVHEREGKGYIVITPVFVKTYRIIDNTGGKVYFRRESIGDKTDKGVAGMTIYVTPEDYIYSSQSGGVGKVIEDVTVTDDKGQEIEVNLYSDARFTMPASDVTVSAVVSDTKYRVETAYEPTGDHGYILSNSKSVLAEGETYEGEVVSYEPYILTGLYAQDSEGNRTDLIANGSYNAETGIVSFTMPAKALTIYREHALHPEYHTIVRDEQSRANASGIGYIARKGASYFGGITGENVVLDIGVYDERYGLSSLYYVDENGEKVDLMPFYNKAENTCTFTMPDSEIMLYYTFRECHTVTVNEYENDFSITGFVGDTIDFEIFINDYAKENAKLDETYFFYYDSNNEYQRLDADWNPETGKGTFVMPDEDITLHIQYMYYRDVPVGTFEHGTVTANKEKAIDGEIVTYTVHPEDGWVVTALGQSMSQYSAQGTQDENNSNIWYVTMPWGWSGERKLWATFEKNPDWHTITIHESENGSVSYGRTGADTGDEVTLTATPDSGYVLKNITVTDAQQNTVPVEGTTFTMPASDVTVSATFAQGEIVEAVEPYIDATGAYILGNVKYFAGADGKNYAVNADGTIGEELESVALSYFDFALLSNDTYQINFYTGPTDTLEELVIPKTFNGKAITILGNDGNNALIDYTGKTKTQFSLILNENITEIKGYTFYTMWVTEVKGDTSRLSTIGDYAFSWANSRGGYAIDISLEYPGTVSVGSEIFNHMIVTARMKHATRLSKSTCGQQSISYAFTDAHTYGEPVWNWAEENTLATASFTCTDTRCNHRETVNADVTHTVKDAVTTYTAIAAFNGNTYTDSVSEGEKANNGVNLTLGGDITSNYYIDYTKYTGAASITYTYNSVNEKEQNVPVTKTIDLSDIPAPLSEGERIKLTVSQAPAQMAETTHIEILNAQGEVIESLDYSAKSYCDSIIAMSDETLAAYAGNAQEAARLKTLVHSLIAYAEAAQGVFADYETTKVTCESDAVKAQIAAATATPAFTLNNSGMVKFASVSFACTKDARLRLFLNTAGATSTPDAPVASDGNAALKYTLSGGEKTYFVELSGIDAVDFDKKITVAYGGSQITLSVLDFCGIVLKEGSTASAAMQTLAKTLIVYHDNAKAYFG